MDRFRSTTTDNWLDDPYPSRAFQRVREFAPSARIANDSGVVSELPVDLLDLARLEWIDHGVLRRHAADPPVGLDAHAASSAPASAQV
jgi:hypothetical protein